MKVLEQCFCLLCLLPPPPLSLSMLLCWPQPKFSSMLPLHCHVLPPPLPELHLFIYLCFFFVLRTRRHTSCFIWGGLFMQSCLCVFLPSMRRQWWILSFFLVLSFFLCLSLIRVYTRMHVWMPNTTSRASILILFLLLFSSCLLNFLVLILSF